MSEYLEDFALAELAENAKVNRIELCLYHRIGEKKELELKVSGLGLSPDSSEQITKFFSTVLGFDLQRHNEYLAEKNKRLSDDISDKQIRLRDIESSIKRQEEELKRAKDKVEKVKQWLVQHNLASDVFDEIPF